MLAGIPYTVDTGEELVNETFGPNNIRRKSSGAQERHAVEVADGRGKAFSLDRNGFVFVEHRSAVRDFLDANELKKVYYPEVAALIRRLAGAARVEVFDHTLRSGDGAEREARLLREPVLSAHNDYTEWSAIADARSIPAQDLLVAERRYPHRVGQTYRLKYGPGHRWFYFPRMRRDEALVFKVFDSATDGRARFTPHTSFDDPSTPAGAPPRQSIEARALAFF